MLCRSKKLALFSFQWFKHVFTRFGNCYTFNAEHWLNSSGADIGALELPLKQIQSGPAHGLSLKLDIKRVRKCALAILAIGLGNRYKMNLFTKIVLYFMSSNQSYTDFSTECRILTERLVNKMCRSRTLRRFVPIPRLISRMATLRSSYGSPVADTLLETLL